jgi:hypothetical protein
MLTNYLTNYVGRADGFIGLGYNFASLGNPCATSFDEDTIMDHADFECLSWKEILSLIDDYYKVNSFLVEKNVLISLNYILPKSDVLCCI